MVAVKIEFVTMRESYSDTKRFIYSATRGARRLWITVSQKIDCLFVGVVFDTLGLLTPETPRWLFDRRREALRTLKQRHPKLEIGLGVFGEAYELRHLDRSFNERDLDHAYTYSRAVKTMHPRSTVSIALEARVEDDNDVFIQEDGMIHLLKN